MLPFEEKPWAKSLAICVIAATILGEIVAILVRLHYGSLDVAEITGLILILLTVVPPNIHIIRRKAGDRAGDRSHPDHPLRSRKPPPTPHPSSGPASPSL